MKKETKKKINGFENRALMWSDIEGADELKNDFDKFNAYYKIVEDERELADDQLERLFEEVGGYVDYWSMHENDECAFEELFENMLDAVRAAQYGDYDYTKPYVKIGNDGNLYSMDRGEYLEELREGKDDLLQIYDELVRDGGIEDFLKEEE